MSLPKTVKLVEVSPRDGLQNEPKSIPTEVKLKLIDQLATAGLKTIEATSFVSAKRVPQMADHKMLLERLKPKSDVRYPVLVPNHQGLENALQAGAKAIAVFAAASETFSQKNINCSIEESLKQYEQVIKHAKEKKLWVRGYISCVIGCPYEGKINPKQIANIANQLFTFGCDEISLGDTTGVGTPNKVIALIHAVTQRIPLNQLAVHFHDTYGQALANIYTALEQGIHIIDASVAGLGGCPYAKGATGNVATEDVLYMLNGLNIKSDVNLEKLIKAGQFICDHLGQPTRSKVSAAWKKGH